MCRDYFGSVVLANALGMLTKLCGGKLICKADAGVFVNIVRQVLDCVILIYTQYVMPAVVKQIAFRKILVISEPVQKQDHVFKAFKNGGM